MPALHPNERRHIRPLVVSIPFLFVAGCCSGTSSCSPAAVHFFQSFNSDQFNVLVQANQYYKFAATTLLAMGLLFQVPVGIVAITRGVRHAPAAAKNRRYAVSPVARPPRSTSGITLLLETVPLYLLFRGRAVCRGDRGAALVTEVKFHKFKVIRNLHPRGWRIEKKG